MTLIFSGNDYKYELEGVMKLFIPATLIFIIDRKSTRLNSSHSEISRMPSSA